MLQKKKKVHTILFAGLSSVLRVYVHQLEDERPAGDDARPARQKVSANQTLQHRAFPAALEIRCTTQNTNKSGLSITEHLLLKNMFRTVTKS